MSKEEKAKYITLDEAEELSMQTDYACFANESTEPINKADAAAFYMEGYNSAVDNLSTQLTAYKEALSSLWSDIHFTDISKEQIMNRIGSLIQPKP